MEMEHWVSIELGMKVNLNWRKEINFFSSIPRSPFNDPKKNKENKAQLKENLFLFAPFVLW